MIREQATAFAGMKLEPKWENRELETSEIQSIELTCIPSSANGKTFMD